MDLPLACLLILLGAMISYLLDEQFGFASRIADWLDRMTGEY
jgi:H+/gluconate symporter-like permease